MRPRLTVVLLISLLAGLGPLTVSAGGAPLGTQLRQVKIQPAWKTTIKLGRITGLAIDRRGNPKLSKWAYTVNIYNRTVVKFGTGGKLLDSWKYAPPAQFVSPAGVAVGGSGNVFVADGGNNRVVKFDPFGHQLAIFTGFSLPGEVAVDRRGNIYVTEMNAPDVVKVSPSGQVLARWHVPWVGGTGNSSPRSVAVDRQGNLYVGASCSSDCPEPHGIQYAVIKLSPSGTMVGSLVGNNPYAPIAPGQEPFVVVNTVAVDGRDNLYVGCDIRTSTGTFSAAVLVYSGGLSLRRTYTLSGQSVPTGIAFDGRGALYVAHNNRVLKWVP